MSFSGAEDQESKLLAEAFGAVAMLDKANLHEILIPEILGQRKPDTALEEVVLLPIDIFKLEAANQVLWIEAVCNLDAAKAKIKHMMLTSTCDYLILNQNTQRTEIVGHEHAIA